MSLLRSLSAPPGDWSAGDPAGQWRGDGSAQVFTAYFVYDSGIEQALPTANGVDLHETVVCVLRVVVSLDYSSSLHTHKKT